MCHVSTYLGLPCHTSRGVCCNAFQLNPPCCCVADCLPQDKVHLHPHERSSLGGTWRSTAGGAAGASGLLDPSLPAESLAVACEARRAALLERESALQVGGFWGC